MNATMTLLNNLNQTEKRRSFSLQKSPLKAEKQRSSAEFSYKRFTNLTKKQQLNQMRKSIRLQNPQWKYEHKKINSSFCQHYQHDQCEELQKSNKKYKRYLQSTSVSNSFSDPFRFQLTNKDGYFSQPIDQLYSKNYRPKVIRKRQFNEDYLHSQSKFGKTWVDLKKDKIMNLYNLQANPFSTQRSNQLICLMRPMRKHRFS